MTTKGDREDLRQRYRQELHKILACFEIIHIFFSLYKNRTNVYKNCHVFVKSSPGKFHVMMLYATVSDVAGAMMITQKPKIHIKIQKHITHTH